MAQTPPPDVLQRNTIESERILRQGGERWERHDPLTPRQVPPAEAEDPEPQSPVSESGGPCFPVSTITVSGAEESLAHLTAPYEGRCLSLSDINAALAELTDHFVELGYVTTRVYVPEQDIADGEFEFVVVDGILEDIRIGDEAELKPGQMATAFPGLIGERLNIRDFEQGLDQINRLRSGNAKVSYVPGEQQGTTVAVVDNPPAKQWRLSLGIDNSGSKSTGEWQKTAAGEVYNLFDANDLITLSYGQDNLNSALRVSESVAGSFSIPWGYWTATLSSSYFRYVSKVAGTAQTFESSGMSRSYRGTLERVLHRDQDSKTVLAASLTRKRTKNYIEDVLVQVNSRRLTVAGLGLTHSRRLGSGLVAVTLGYEAGLDAFDAKSDRSRNNQGPEAQFEKWTGEVTLNQPFELGGLNFTWSTGATGQWSQDTLFSTERIGIGGLHSVRGFKDESVSGDIGGFVRNELALNLPINAQPFAALTPVIQPFVAFDFGAIRQDSTEEFERGSMAGWAAGLRSSGGYLGFSATYAQSVQAPSFLSPPDRQVYFSATVNF